MSVMDAVRRIVLLDGEDEARRQAELELKRHQHDAHLDAMRQELAGVDATIALLERDLAAADELVARLEGDPAVSPVQVLEQRHQADLLRIRLEQLRTSRRPHIEEQIALHRRNRP